LHREQLPASDEVPTEMCIEIEFCPNRIAGGGMVGSQLK
jgi:hypothetical protein